MSRAAILITLAIAIVCLLVSQLVHFEPDPAFSPPDFLHLIGMWFICAIAALYLMRIAPLPLLKLGGGLGHWLHARQPLPKWVWPAGAFILFTGIAAYLSQALFQHMPHINDSVNQYVHAKFLASGHVALTSHPLKEFFDSGWMVNDGRWYSAYSPGFMLLLAIGHIIDMPWVINPVLGGLTAVTLYFLARELYDARTAKVTALLACLSPLMLVMSAEYMNHATTLLFTTLFLLFFVRTLRGWSVADVAFAGTSFGMVAITRPFTGLAIALPFALLGLYHLYKSWRCSLKPFAFMSAVITLFALFHMWWNLQTTGHPLELAYEKLLGPEHWPGLGRNPWGNPHSVLSGLMMLGNRVIMMNDMLFEWVLPSLLFVLMLFFSGITRKADWLLLSVYVSLAAAYVFFQGKGNAFGPRYHYEAVGALIVLTAAGITRMPLIARQRFGLRHAIPRVHGVTLLIVASLFALSWPNTIPPRWREYSQHYSEGNADYYFDIMSEIESPALVFVPAAPWPNPGPYLYVAHTLPPKDDAPAIFARDMEEHNQALLEYYPCRYAYLRDLKDNMTLLRSPGAECPNR